MTAPIESPSNTKNREPGFAPGFPQWTTTPERQRSGLQLPEGCATHSQPGALVRHASQIPREGGRDTAIFGSGPETRLARILNPNSFMDPRPGRLPELEATRPHMEPKASCPAAAPLMERKFHVLVGVTGSVAALKLPLLVSKLLDIPGRDKDDGALKPPERTTMAQLEKGVSQEQATPERRCLQELSLTDILHSNSESKPTS
ncbi:phosphopantothenoylcysteine decarboxylase isoform X6 [Pongo abelii]|uniref:phosphopantothenoylcysteine decarboxylase isoform X6 n=1 Tax=Pongo abelii TaxID=9601 RepID=UPI00300452EC